MIQPDDNSLLSRMQMDDPGAFEKLYNFYHKRVYCFALQIMPSAADAEEIVQNVFIAVWNQRKSIRISGGFLSYLFGIARHQVCDMIQKKIRHKAFIEYCLEMNHNFDFITEETVLCNELSEIIKELLLELPVRRREIFTLSRMEGLSYLKIAEKLGITENTVDTQIRLALNHIRSSLLKLRV